MAANHDRDDLAPQETGYVRVVGHSSAQQPPVWRPRLVLTPGAESPGPEMAIVTTPRTVEEFVGFLDQQLEAAAERPLGESPVVLRTTEIFVLFELVQELAFVYAGTPLANLALRVTGLLHDRMVSEGQATEIAAARRVVMPLLASRVTPESLTGGLWRVDDATGRPVGLISERGAFSPAFAPTQPGLEYDIGDLVRITRPFPRDEGDFPTIEEALAALERYVSGLATK